MTNVVQLPGDEVELLLNQHCSAIRKDSLQLP